MTPIGVQDAVAFFWFSGGECSQTPQHTPVLALGLRLGLTLDFAPPNVDETPPDAALCAIVGLYLQLRSALGMPRFDDGFSSGCIFAVIH